MAKDPTPTNDYWWEEDVFSKDDKQTTTNATKTFVDELLYQIIF